MREGKWEWGLGRDFLCPKHRDLDRWEEGSYPSGVRCFKSSVPLLLSCPVSPSSCSAGALDHFPLFME